MTRRTRSIAAAAAALLSLFSILAAPARAAAPPRTPALSAPAANGPAATPRTLPEYTEPAAYSVNLVVTSPGSNLVMKRSIDHGRIRTEITGAEQDVVMIELGDEQGTSLILMPDEKRAIKQSRAAMESMRPDGAKRAPEPEAGAPTLEMKIEDLGDEVREGRTLRKLRFHTPEGPSLGWFDKTTGAPVRMEAVVDGQTSVVEWRDYKVAPQPASLFETPKGYELTDMDEMMAKMKQMGGPAGMVGMAGMPGMAGMGGVGGMAGGMGQSMGQSMGGNLGASLGGAFGGPLGAVAGQYIGGKVGGAIGRKAADVVVPGK